ncbi:unnamed protein product, partial [Prorocentrum cordatum]
VIEKYADHDMLSIPVDGGAWEACDWNGRLEVLESNGARKVPRILAAAKLRDIRRVQMSAKLPGASLSRRIQGARGSILGDSEAPAEFNLTLDNVVVQQFMAQ